MGMLLLAGVAFLALSASSASARTGVAASAESVNTVVLAGGGTVPAPPDAVLSVPIVAPSGVGVPIYPEPWPIPGPGASGSVVDPIGFQEPISLGGGQGQPIDPDPGPSAGGEPRDVTPIPIAPFEIA